MSSIVVLIGGAKGGSTKTTTSHSVCLGASLHNVPAVCVVTDPERKVRGEGRPYGVLDGRLPDQLARILTLSKDLMSHGWTIVDGAGNRPEVDKVVSEVADLVVIPFRPSEEDVDTVGKDLNRLPNAFAWPSAWPVNAHAERAAAFLIQ